MNIIIHYLLDFIFTFSKYRKNNYASLLLSFLKENIEITALCSNDISVKLFEKNNFRNCNSEYSYVLMKYP